jgi:hypothetical protein
MLWLLYTWGRRPSELRSGLDVVECSYKILGIPFRNHLQKKCRYCNKILSYLGSMENYYPE